jgi:hypothetical protein
MRHSFVGEEETEDVVGTGRSGSGRARASGLELNEGATGTTRLEPV